MNLTDLASEGRFKAHKTSKAEINQLLADRKTVKKLNKFRQKRNIADYERIGLVSEKEVDEMLDLAKRLRLNLAYWLKNNYPEFI